MKIAAIIPCYRVKNHILEVLQRIGPQVHHIYVVDDACPEGSGHHVKAGCTDPRVTVLVNEKNLGVGGATMTGYQRAIKEGADILVKLDGDGQMAPELIPQLIKPLADGHADYAKGNRFYDPETIRPMPIMRLLGNAVLSLMSKCSSGYWKVVDPTNGFTAIYAQVLKLLPLHRISRDFFFESDLLFRLNVVDAVVCDVPMKAHYGDEKSNLKIGWSIFRFSRGHLLNTLKRILYCHFIRGFSIASLHLLLAIPLGVFSLIFGGVKWAQSIQDGQAASSGTVMLAGLTFLVALQLLLSFLDYDMRRTQDLPRHKLL